MTDVKETIEDVNEAVEAAVAAGADAAEEAVEEVVEAVEEAAAEAEEAVESIFARIRTGFKEAGAALADSGTIMGDKRREVLLTMLENAQTNADATFDALREVMEAESFGDSLRIQRDALREGIDRNVAQVRKVTSLTAEGSKETIAPVTEYLGQLRDKVRGGSSANA
ncbi:MAG: phasin family protein [Pseudomonadota bacterium]